MNIFYIDTHARIAAQQLVDKHVVKMIVESAQMLCTTHHLFCTNTPEMYRKTHVNHPSTVWVRSNENNYYWLYSHLCYMCEEYTKRYGKHHKTEQLLNVLEDAPDGMPCHISPIFRPPPQCMPDKYKIPNDTVQAYRDFYYHEKIIHKGMGVWTRTEVPDWVKRKQEEETMPYAVL